MTEVIAQQLIKPDYAIRGTDQLETQEKEEFGRIFKIWYVEPQIDLNAYVRENNIEAYQEDFGKITTEEQVRDFIARRNKKQHARSEDVQKISSEREQLQHLTNNRMEEVQKDPEKRPFLIENMSASDLSGSIRVAYEFYIDPPEIIILRYDKNNYETKFGSGMVERIRKFIHKAIATRKMEDRENLLQPIIVVVTPDKDLKRIFLEQGANLVAEDFNIDDINDLAQLAAKIKSDPASLAPEIVKAEKNKFYARVAGLEMGDRSQVTADTGQELQILADIFEKNKVKKILDVGCGNGRIDEPLSQNQELEILAMDSNEELLTMAREKIVAKNVKFVTGDLLNYTQNEQISHETQDAVIYTWHSILEAFGPGNLLKTLNSAWLALKENGVLIFDMPTRENFDMKDGWYQNKIDEDTEYLSYIMTEEEIRFVLRMTGFDPEKIVFRHWQTKPSELYPEGMKKITVTAIKK